MSDKPWISIIGAGRVGTALAELAARAGYVVRCVASRDPKDARKLAARLGGDTMARSVASAAAGSDIVILAVPDDEIAGVCDMIAKGSAVKPGAVVTHCAGVLSSEELAEARERRGCAVASFHPLQTFAEPSQKPTELPENTYCCIEGDPRAVEALDALASDMGFRPVRIKTETKALYHAAAAMACNYLTALLDAALTTAEQAGIPRDAGTEAMEPLIRATVDHFFKTGPEAALTGPIARGDIRTIESHIMALATSSHTLRDLYRAMGLWTVSLARRKGSIGEGTADQIMGLLGE